MAGGCAVYARGGPVTTHDIDIFLREQDVPSAAAALHEAGLRLEDPPENWLTKAYDGSVLVDLIFCPTTGPSTRTFWLGPNPCKSGRHAPR